MTAVAGNQVAPVFFNRVRSPEERVESGATSEKAAPAEGWPEVIDRLLRFRRLERDWDGLGAEAPMRPVIDAAIQLAQANCGKQSAPAPSRVLPTPTGTILMEWHDGDIYFECEVVAPDRFEWMLAIPGQSARHWVA